MSYPAMIVLTSGQMTIEGPGASLLTVKRDGSAPAFRIFEIAGGETVSLSGLTISGGFATGSFPANFGGGIFNDSGATLTISNSALSDNSANTGGGISNDGGTLTISNCFF